MSNITDCESCVELLRSDVEILYWHYFLFSLLVLIACVNDLFYALFEDLRYEILLRVIRQNER